MKKIVLSLLAFVSFNTAFAFVGNDGPQATPGLPSSVIVERMESGGFFVPPGALLSETIRISSNGLVTQTKYLRGENSTPTTTVILTLSANQLAKIQQLVLAVRIGKMIDPNPQAPMCQDAPYSRDTVYQMGTRIDIAERSGCKSFVHENANAADAQLIAILNKIEKRIATK